MQKEKERKAKWDGTQLNLNECYIPTLEDIAEVEDNEITEVYKFCAKQLLEW